MVARLRGVHDASFYQKYIAQRRPCIIESIPSDLVALSELTNLTTLQETAGDVSITVEPISDRGTFGTAATKQEMKFGSFLQKLHAGDKLYLTTQYSEAEEAEVLNEPLLTLRQSVGLELLPVMAGSLVPAKINLWLGASTEGTSSGLHHDFHDNFYLLLSGEKKFRIFPPSWKACKALKVHGRPHEIYDNGLISYNGKLGADGLHDSVRAQIRVELCETRLKVARESREGVKEAEASYEAAMEALLETKLGDGDGSEQDDFDGSDDYTLEADGYEDDTNEEDVDEPSDSAIEAELQGLSELPEFSASAKAAQTPDLSPISESSEPQTDMELNGNASNEEEEEEGDDDDDDDDNDDDDDDDEPPSFSKLTGTEISSMLKDSSLGGEEFLLHAGEMLYLPASYFHEVISTSGSQDFHMAVNYWFYPPTHDEQNPYEDSEVMNELRKRVSQQYPAVSPSPARAVKKVKV